MSAASRTVGSAAGASESASAGVGGAGGGGGSAAAQSSRVVSRGGTTKTPCAECVRSTGHSAADDAESKSGSAASKSKHASRASTHVSRRSPPRLHSPNSQSLSRVSACDVTKMKAARRHRKSSSARRRAGAQRASSAKSAPATPLRSARGGSASRSHVAKTQRSARAARRRLRRRVADAVGVDVEADAAAAVLRRRLEEDAAVAAAQVPEHVVGREARRAQRRRDAADAHGTNGETDDGPAALHGSSALASLRSRCERWKALRSRSCSAEWASRLVIAVAASAASAAAAAAEARRRRPREVVHVHRLHSSRFCISIGIPTPTNAAHRPLLARRTRLLRPRRARAHLLCTGRHHRGDDRRGGEDDCGGAGAHQPR